MTLMFVVMKKPTTFEISLKIAGKARSQPKINTFRVQQILNLAEKARKRQTI
jgi:hypothetical protein